MTATTTGFDWAKTLKVHITLETLDCCNCGIPFAVPADYRAYLREHPELSFYCPNGHTMHYPGKTEAEKQKERADKLARRLDWTKQDLESERRQHSATKGKLTKATRRAAHGVCPVPDCRRSFANLRDHMASAHPGHVHDADQAAGVNGPADGPYGRMEKVQGGRTTNRYRCPCGWKGSTAGGHAARHARTCVQAR